VTAPSSPAEREPDACGFRPTSGPDLSSTRSRPHRAKSVSGQKPTRTRNLRDTSTMKSPPLFSRRPRLLTLLAVLLTAIVVVASVDGLTPRASAQEGEGEGGGAVAAPATPQASPWDVFKHTIWAIRYWSPILGLCSIAIVTLVVLLGLELRLGAAVPPS